MARLYVHGQLVSHFYRLLGRNEDALTFALAHGLAEEPALLRQVLRLLGVQQLGRRQLLDVQVRLQEFEKGSRTDIEFVLAGSFRIILEAKIRSSVPNATQLTKYQLRLAACSEPSRKIAALVQARSESLRQRLEIGEAGDVQVLSWGSILRILERFSSRGGASQNVRGLRDFAKEVYRVKEIFDHEVWVVPLGNSPVADGGTVRFRDVPSQFGVYLFPVRYNPANPQFIAFRCDGRLESVHRILEKSGPVTSNYSEVIPLESTVGEPCAVYRLGPPIPLASRPRSGPLPDRRLYCDLDLLLTSPTILDAYARTQDREKEESSS